MRFLGILLLLGGYTLVYASVAASGAFATEPWAGLFGDAYTFDFIMNEENTATKNAINKWLQGPLGSKLNLRSKGETP